MCLHSQAKSHPEISLLDGIKADLRRAIDNYSVYSVVTLTESELELESAKMTTASNATLRKLIKPQA